MNSNRGRNKKGKKPRLSLRMNPLQNRPPGLQGREIGLYYRNLHQNQPGKMSERSEKMDTYLEYDVRIYLRIPLTLIEGIYTSLNKIKSIAEEKNIYLPPAKKLTFLASSESSDFIPLNPDVPEVAHSITNIRKKDNDIILIKPERLEPIEVCDSSSEDIDTEGDKAGEVPGLSNSTSANNKEYYVSNNYMNILSSSNNDTFQRKTYKYGYEDIITGTFQEKLDKCLAKGIEITLKTSATDVMNTAFKANLLDMVNNNRKYKNMLIFREKLPTFKKAEHLLAVINRNQVVVISGETGCGKSTQVPQLILDEAVAYGRGANIKVLVTEPRRIAASSLAVRVAEERGEELGRSVGYSVRLESVKSRERGSIMFCTTGVLLVELEQNQALSSYSHIILDEVHERDCHIDIAMCMLKQVLQKRKDLKLILMSATVDAETLSKYFNNCPLVHIEGLAYPVKDIYLEEILDITNYRLPQRTTFQEYKPKVWHKYTAKGRRNIDSMEKEIQYKASIAPWLKSAKKRLPREIFNQVQDYRIENLNLMLILNLLKYICRQPPGAILVFLPGISEISKLTIMIKECPNFPTSSHNVYALHSKLPTMHQNMIFNRPPNGVRKIILATNIAETSITIDDIVYVVDSGKMKHKGLNVEKNLATLEVEWISKANLKQRRGRAGRCQPGICYHLMTTHRASILDERAKPELQRSNLYEEVLAMKKLRLGKVEQALNMMPSVPAEKTIKSAIQHLQHIGALDEEETLTPLGWHLARLPIHPAAGKLLLLGALFGCLDRAAGVAAVWGYKDPFQLVIGKEDEVNQARRDLAMGEPSDHVAISEAIIQWEICETNHERTQVANNYFLSHINIRLLSDMKWQFANNLKEMGFLRKPDIKSTWENRNTNNLSLFKAIVAAALYPNIATVKWVNEKFPNPNKPMKIKAFTPEEGKVAMHPSSVMFTQRHRRDREDSKINQSPIATNVGANWLVYWIKHKSTDVYLIDVTCVYTLPLLFFGDINFSRAKNPDECLISICSTNVCCKKETAELLFQLRSLLDQVLTSKISHSSDPTVRRSQFDEEVLDAVISLITAEDEGTEYIDHNDVDDDYYEYQAVPRNGLSWNNHPDEIDSDDSDQAPNPDLQPTTSTWGKKQSNTRKHLLH